MNYRLVVTTCGREGLLDRTLESFGAHVRPRPAEAFIVDDSGDVGYGRYLDDLCREEAETHGGKWSVVSHGRRLGFCETVAEAWFHAGSDGPPFVFWLEDDFVFTRAVPLEDLAYVLERQPHLAQMSLMRNAVSDEEKAAAGGLVEMREGSYARRGSGAVAWLEHVIYWTTNPSLFRREIPARHEWPVIDHCEGVFTHDLLVDRPETTFGVWGVGEPWVEHIGVRAGVGY